MSWSTMQPGSPVTFSVVISNYNHADYLSTCLDSVVAQSFQPISVHVIDDASTDRSVEVIRSYVARHPHFHLIQNAENRGNLANLNEILPQLQCTHAFFLAADDYLCPGSFARAYALLATQPRTGVCLADFLELSPDGRQKRFSYGLADQPAYFSPSQLPLALRGLGLVGQGFFRVDELRRMGGFPENLRWHTDHFTCMVLAARSGLGYLPEVGGVFRKLPTSYSAKGMNSAAQQSVLAAFLEHLQRPEFGDVKNAFRQSHALAIFGPGLFSALWKNPGHRCFLTPSFVARLLWRSIRGRVRHPVPQPVKQWVRRRFTALRKQ